MCLGLSLIEGTSKGAASALAKALVERLFLSSGRRDATTAWYSALDMTRRQIPGFVPPADFADLRTVARIPVDMLRPGTPSPSATMFAVLLAYEVFCDGAVPNPEIISSFAKTAMHLWLSEILEDDVLYRRLLELHSSSSRDLLDVAVEVSADSLGMLSDFDQVQHSYFATYSDPAAPQKLELALPSTYESVTADRNLEISCWSYERMPLGFYRPNHYYSGPAGSIHQAVADMDRGVEIGIPINSGYYSGGAVLWNG